MRLRRVLALTCSLALLYPALPAAAAGKPAAASGEPILPPGFQPDMSSDEAGLWMQMARIEEALKSSPILIKDPALNAYVKGVICKIAAPYCGSIRLYILDVPYFNAVSLPNGAIIVYSGLLLRTENEAQLAFVLGHEITHYVRRHSLDQFHRLVSSTGAGAVFTVMTFGLGAIAMIGQARALMAHTRDQEREADAGGFERGVAAGYDPRQAPAIWRFLTDEYNANPDKDSDLFFADHPQPQERLATMDKDATAAVGERTDWIVDQDHYRAAMTPFLERWIADEVEKGEAEETVVLFQRLARNQPDMGLFQYALGESYRKRNAAGDKDKAVAAFHAALADTGAPALVWRGLGLIAMKDGDKAGARDDFTHYRALLPDAGDKAMIDFYLTQL